MTFMSTSCDKLLQLWAKETRTTLGEYVCKLISQANFDLWHGPCKNGAYGDPAEGDPEWDSYPGFSKATDQIAGTLREYLPSCLYLDVDAGYWTENEPEPEMCETCCGQGCNGPDEHKTRCNDCNGRGQFDPCGDWWKLERHDLIVALVGKELAEYVS